MLCHSPIALLMLITLDYAAPLLMLDAARCHEPLRAMLTLFTLLPRAAAIFAAFS